MDRQTNSNIKLIAIASIAPLLFFAGSSLAFLYKNLVRSGCQSALAAQFCKYTSMTLTRTAIPLELIAVSAMLAMNKKTLKKLNYTLIFIAIFTPLLFCMGISICLVEKQSLAWLAALCFTIPGPIGSTAVLIFLIINFKRLKKTAYWLGFLPLLALFLVNLFCFLPIHSYAISHCGVLNSFFQLVVRLCEMTLSLVGIQP